MTQDTHTQEETTQLLVPKSRQEWLFQVAHLNPMAGHLGQDKTQNCLMARFYQQTFAACLLVVRGMS